MATVMVVYTGQTPIVVDVTTPQMETV